MTAGRWQQVRAILFAASAMENERRAQYVAEQCGDDDPLRCEVEELLRALDESGGFLEPAAHYIPGLTEVRIGPYLMLEEAGHGGMGVVYRARRDNDYRQIVAIKLVRVELATQALIERFRIERQALARLNHPNIARLLDGGTTADGRPYLVMDWVDGKPIHEYCRAAGLTAHQRLRLFLQVCDAVAHAHRNLVVHRDLKPSNILITADGQPKLLDFGIAKIFGADQAEPEVTQAFGCVHPLTPDYASPEQVRGEPVTMATDVYSLGAVLYELLTGCRPHQIESYTPAGIERAVCLDSSARASTVTAEGGVPREELKGDLDDILAKALEKEPAQRYAYVDGLASDLQRHLDGLPVSARRASYWYRASRFVRRKKLVAASVAAVTLSLLGGLTAALWQARVARQERRLAEQRFEMARQLAGSVLYEFQDGIRDLQGSLRVQQLILTRSLQYLDALAAGAQSNPALQRDLAAGYERVATIEGIRGVSNLGQPKAAIESLRKALVLRTQVLATEPGSVIFRRELARTHRMFSDLDVPLAERLEHVRSSALLIEQLRREVPGNPEIQNELAISEYGMATSLQAQSRFPEAMTDLRKALADTPPSRHENLALYHKRLGALLVVTKDLPAALAEYQSAVAIDEQRVGSHPDDARARMDLSFGYSDIGLICQLMGKMRDGLEQYRKAERIRAEVSAADPHDQRAASSLGMITLRIGELLELMGDRRASEAAFARGIELGELYRNRFPQSRDARSLLADGCRVFGRAYQRSWSSCDKARPWLERAAKLYKEDGNTNGVNWIAEISQACRQ